jgi:hypothetical protein
LAAEQDDRQGSQEAGKEETGKRGRPFF